MKTLSDNDLTLVTGGKSTPSATTVTPGSGSSSSNNDALLSQLQGIQSSLSDLGKNQNNGLFGGTNGLMFMTMALALSQRRNEVVVYGGGYHRGFSWRVW